ncbi:MAG: tRNA lysidine(34) synthetase TilS [Clostridiales bacterium]|nr:tRNA lysidine(34) synthetase TilS [Clostridiales bacterium]
MVKHHMTAPGDVVITGVSGGADSVCLLLMLKSLEPELSIQVRAVHVNHGLRQDADEDEAYVKELCERLQVPLRTVHVNVEEYAAQEGLGLEEAGRLLRYRTFEEWGAELLREQEAVIAESKGERLRGRGYKIAVAHHMDDRAETVLFHLFRGTGLSGLIGIRPVRERVIRPLLCITRTEIETWLSKENIPYCMDSTNLEDTYTRNKIRHHVLPYAEQEICSRSMEHITRAADICMETEEYLEIQIRRFYDKCVTWTDKRAAGIAVQEFAKEHPFLQKSLILSVFEELTPCRKDMQAVHVEDVCSLFRQEGNRQISLPYNLIARREYDTVVIEEARRREKGKGEGVEIDRKFLEQQGIVRVLLGDGREFICELISLEESRENVQNIPQKTYTKWFDYDKIRKSMIIRCRQSGDYLTIRREGEEPARKKLKEYFITEKIPKQMRDEILLLADGQHVLWVIGHRISEYYKVNPNTRRILQVQLRGEEADG